MIGTARARGRMAAAVVIAFFTTVPAALAGPADLDTGFGSSGTGYASFETGGGLHNGDAFRDLAVGPGDSIAVGAHTGSTMADPGNDETGIAVFGSGGSLNPAFGGDGTVSTRFGDRSDVRGVAVQSDGKVVAVGRMSTGADTRGYVARWNTDGTPDASFAPGGMKTFASASDDLTAEAVLVDPDGTIVVAGTADSTQDFSYWLSKVTAASPDTITTGAAGRPDGGLGSLDNDGARNLIRTPSGEYLVAGTIYQDADNDTVYEATMAVSRYSANGSPAQFSTAQHYGFPGVLDADGNNLRTEGRAVAVMNDKIYVAGVSRPNAGHSEIVLARFDADGSRDNGFGAQGVRKFGDPSNHLQVRDLAAVDGRLLGVGSSKGSGGSDILAIRWLSDGAPDPTWGSGGIRAFDLGNVSPSTGEDVGLGFQSDGRPIVGGTAFKTGIFGAVGRLGTVDIAPPPPGGGDPAPAGSGNPGGGSGPAPTPGGSNPVPIQFVETTMRAKMPDVRGTDVRKAILKLDGRFFSDVDVKYTNEKTGKANEIGEVAIQKPAAGADLTSAAGDPERVVLTVYEGPKPVGKSKCPEEELKKELKGLGAYFSLQVAQQLKCRVEVEVVPAPAAQDESVSKVTAKDNKVVVTIRQPTKPERNELFLGFRGVRPVKSNVTFNANDWSLPVGPLASMGVTVMTRGGDLIKNAQVSIDGTDVGGKDTSRPSGADGAGLAYLTVQPKKAGAVTVSARAEVGGQVLTGVAVINVKETKGTFTTVNGENITLDSRGAVQKVTEPSVRSAGLGDLWNQFLQAIGLGSPTAQQVNQPGRTPEQNLAAAASAKKAYPVQVALGQPLNGNAKAATTRSTDVGLIQNGRVGKAKATVVDTTRGNFIAASGIIGQNNANIIGQAGGNIIGPAAGNVISREIDLKRAKIISDNGLGLISDNGLGIISDNGLGILSDNGLGLVPPKNGMLATSVSGIVSTYGGG